MNEGTHVRCGKDTSSNAWLILSDSTLQADQRVLDPTSYDSLEPCQLKIYSNDKVVVVFMVGRIFYRPCSEYLLELRSFLYDPAMLPHVSVSRAFLPYLDYFQLSPISLGPFSPDIWRLAGHTCQHIGKRLDDRYGGGILHGARVRDVLSLLKKTPLYWHMLAAATGRPTECGGVIRCKVGCYQLEINLIRQMDQVCSGSPNVRNIHKAMLLG
jgi:hypothetical protein